MCAVIAALGCAACSAEPPMLAQKPAAAAPAAAGSDVMVVVPSAGRTLLPYPETDAFRECAPFARAVSGIDIHGDAWSWWGKASGRYQRGNLPEIGAVMVLQRSHRTPLGHVSVVAEIQDSRHILVTHANWGSDGSTRGMIHERQPVEDMSAANDWSVVKMWNTQAEFGSNYQTYGFIYNRGAQPGEAVVEQAVAREPVAVERPLLQTVSYTPSSRHDSARGGAHKGRVTEQAAERSAERPSSRGAHSSANGSHAAAAPAKSTATKAAAAKPADGKAKHRAS